MMQENATPPDEAATEWYEGNRQAQLQNVEADLNKLATGYSELESAWHDADRRENEAHETLDTKALVQAIRDKERYQADANLISNAWSERQAQKQYLESNPDPNFTDVLSSSSPAAQMFLRTHRSQLEGNPGALKALMAASARCLAVGIKPDSKNYFSALETAAGLDAEDRSLDDFSELSDEQRASKNATKRESPDKFKATEAQKAMAHALPGVSPEEYLAQVANPFSQASQTVSLEPSELDFGQSNKGMEVSFDEAPKKTPVKYRQPDPKSSVTLSPAELSLIENMAVTTGKPLAEMRKEFAQQKLALHSGKTSHMLYQDRLKAMGQA